jgi:hypothetical protein
MITYSPPLGALRRFDWKIDCEDDEGVQEEARSEAPLAHEKAHNSLRSYSTKCLALVWASFCVGAPTIISQNLAWFWIPQ